jgi:hypothetical protein
MSLDVKDCCDKGYWCVCGGGLQKWEVMGEVKGDEATRVVSLKLSVSGV